MNATTFADGCTIYAMRLSGASWRDIADDTGIDCAEVRRRYRAFVEAAEATPVMSTQHGKIIADGLYPEVPQDVIDGAEVYIAQVLGHRVDLMAYEVGLTTARLYQKVAVFCEFTGARRVLFSGDHRATCRDIITDGNKVLV